MTLAIDVEAFYVRYGPMVLRRCRHLLKDEDAALDAMQETFVKLLQNQRRLTAQAPSSLLYRMATNVCLNRLRSRGRRPETADEALLLKIACAEDLEERSAASDLLGWIFSREPESTRAIAVMLLHDGMTLQEVADEVGMSVSGVRKRIRTLRERLEVPEAPM